MYELIQISENDYYVQMPAKAGVVKLSDNEVCLIDSGNDADAGKRIKRILDEKGWELKAIFNTHSHADHIGGNKYLYDKTGCRIFACGLERDFTEHTLLEPMFLFGACPPPELKHKFLYAKESPAEKLTEEMLPRGWEMISLPGHTPHMTGFRTADNDLFIGDCLSGRETLEKYQISFLTDVKDYLDTLEKVSLLRGNMFVPAHAPVSENVSELARINISKVHEIEDTIVHILKAPQSFDSLLKNVFDRYGLTMDIVQYALVGNTVKAYLTYLKENGRADFGITDNRLLWRSM